MTRSLYAGGAVWTVVLLSTQDACLLLPPKVDGGYVFTPVCLFLHLSVSMISQKVMDGFG